MRIGIIGAAGGQGQRFLNLNLDNDIEYVLYDHHGEIKKIQNIDKYQVTTRIENLLECKGVVIASPNDSHIHYIQYLVDKDYKGYVYCEKTPVSNSEDISSLESLEESVKKRVLFGFDLERSLYKKILDGKYNLGNLLYCNFISGHGLGFKSFYKESWRNDADKCKNGIFGMVSVHYLEMFIAKYGFPKEENIFECVKSPGGITNDNSLYSAVWGDEKVLLNIYVSYTTPLIEKSDFIFDNGYISITENDTVIYSPRDCFDQTGMFRKPNVAEQIPIGTKQIWDSALEDNFKYFIEKVRCQEDISLKEFENSINVNKYILNL